MKASNRILIITGAVVVAVVLTLIITSRVFVVDLMNREFPEDGIVIAPNTRTATKAYEISGFDTVDASGAWQIEVRRSDGFGVELSVPESVADYLIVERTGSTLTLGTTKPVKLPDEKAMKAVISAPEIRGVRSTGFAEVQMSGFRGGDLELSGEGVISFHTGNGSFDRVTVDFKGVGSFDMRDTATRDAHIEIDGISNVELTMNGGVLSGKIDIGSLKYRGDVKEVTVKGGQVAVIERSN